MTAARERSKLWRGNSINALREEKRRGSRITFLALRRHQRTKPTRADHDKESQINATDDLCGEGGNELQGRRKA